MSIDRIGKGPGIVPPTSSEIAGPSPTGAREAFRVSRAEATGAAGPVERVQAGEINVDEYLDIKVNEATAHLSGTLAPDQLAFVKESLREQLATDPALVDLVRGASGAIPPPRE